MYVYVFVHLFLSQVVRSMKNYTGGLSRLSTIVNKRKPVLCETFANLHKRLKKNSTPRNREKLKISMCDQTQQAISLRLIRSSQNEYSNTS